MKQSPSSHTLKVSETDIFCHLQNQPKVFTPKNVVSAQGNCSPPLPIEVQLEHKQNARSILINPQHAASSPKRKKKKKKTAAATTVLQTVLDNY
jgi:hypothetical protein